MNKRELVNKREMIKILEDIENKDSTRIKGKEDILSLFNER